MLTVKAGTAQAERRADALAPQPTSPVLEDIAQRIRRANITAGVLCANIDALGDRALGPQPMAAGTAGKDDVTPFSRVQEIFNALAELDAMIGALDRATSRILVLA